MNQRPPAVSGMFYPSEAAELGHCVSDMLVAADAHPQQPQALIAPHAGYIYSGPIAASAYRSLKSIKHAVDRVVLLGPSHRVPLAGAATPGCEAFLTPLGSIPVDSGQIAEIEQHPLVAPNPAAHALEHSLEVQLPFLQTVLGDFALVPLVVGDIGVPDMADIIARLWRDKRTLVVVSSDLSHYLPYATARIKDRHTTELIEQLDTRLDSGQACGCRPLNGLLALCGDRKLHVTNIDLRNSGDTAGTKDQVVGYGAYVVH